MVPHGTRILAQSGRYLIAGNLIGDHDDLDSLVNVLTDDDRLLTLNGWMFAFEVPEPEEEPACALSAAE